MNEKLILTAWYQFSKQLWKIFINKEFTSIETLRIFLKMTKNSKKSYFYSKMRYFLVDIVG